MAPFGPGFTIEKQRIEVTYSNDAPDHVTVRGWYRMKNTGTQPLNEMSLRLPLNWEFAPRNIHAQWMGKPLTLPAFSNDQKNLRVPLGPRLNVGDRGEFVVSYDSESPVVKPAAASQGGAAFFLPTSHWYPVWGSPHETFSSGGHPPLKWDLIVTVPNGYRVHASGRERGQSHPEGKNGAGTAFRFEQISLNDFEPFVEAGPFLEQVVKLSQGRVIFWTYQLVPDGRAREIGDRVASDAAFFKTEFGSSEKGGQEARIVECLGDWAEPIQKPWGCATVPHSAVVPPDYLANGAARNLFASVDSQLAATYFDLSVHISPDGPGYPLAEARHYALFARGVSDDPSSRTAIIRDLLHGFYAIPVAADKPMARIISGDPEPLQQRAALQSLLFFVALEDRCGASNLHHALARAARILHGQAWGVADLRSAAEAECGADLGEFIRQWLARPGIPEDFRTRYGEASTSAPKQPVSK
ncbi:MAG TPA: hypothetical protein VKS20_03960 [Candidatus Acidoferrales bacterium]|nr:hypothetical protein [Candidatus Acidoferrales bacterium]